MAIDAREIILTGPMPPTSREQQYWEVLSKEDAETFCLPLTLATVRTHAEQCPIIADWLQEFDAELRVARLEASSVGEQSTITAWRVALEARAADLQRLRAEAEQRRIDRESRSAAIAAAAASATRRTAAQQAELFVSRLLFYEVSRMTILYVLYGHPAYINAAGRQIRKRAYELEQGDNTPPNSHTVAINLLRRCGLPGSDAAKAYAARFGTPEEIARVEAGSIDGAREAADALAERVSAVNTVESSQEIATRQLTSAVHRFLHSYNETGSELLGDFAAVVQAAVRSYVTNNEGAASAGSVDSCTSAAVLSDFIAQAESYDTEQSNSESLLSLDAGAAMLHGRDSGESDGSDRRTRPRIIDL